MKYRLMALLLALCMLAALPGCNKTKDMQQPVTFYFPAKQTESLSRNTLLCQYFDAVGYDNDIHHLLNAYLNYKVDEECISPFPAKLHLALLSRQGDTLHLTFNETLGNLSGIDLSLACVCIAKTAMELSGCTQVVVQASDALLDGEKSLTFTQDGLHFYENNSVTNQN